MFAIQKAYLDGSLGKGKWSNNIIAGLVVGVVALPLAMAFAIASGVTPQAGIYTAIIAGIFVSLFGGSPVQIAGPTGAFIVLLSSIVVNYGFEGLQIATMMGRDYSGFNERCKVRDSHSVYTHTCYYGFYSRYWCYNLGRAMAIFLWISTVALYGSFP